MSILTEMIILCAVAAVGLLLGVGLLLLGLLPKGKPVVWRVLFSVFGGMTAFGSLCAIIYYVLAWILVNANH